MVNPTPVVLAESSDELTQIKKQYREFLWKLEEEKPKASPVLDWMHSLGADGSWKNVHYENDGSSYSQWKAMAHLQRLLSMSAAYANPGSKLYGNQELGTAIHSALGYWLGRDLQNSNWWYNEIGVPMVLSQILLFLDQKVAPDEMSAGLKIVSRSDKQINKMTGQNLVWTSGITLTRGLVENRFDIVQEKRNVILSEVAVTTQEGVQPDFSFHQHGPQQQFGNYGLGFADDIVQWMLILRGTSLALDHDPEKVEVMRNYLLQGEDYVVWKGSMDISSCGRQLFPRSPLNKGSSVRKIMEHMLLADPSHAASYQASLDRNVSKDVDTLTGNRFFWRSDYMVHRRPGFFVSTKMSSSRVFGTEVVNDENLSGANLGNGATYLYQTNHEYEDIFAVWDWFRVPGVTCYRENDKKFLHPDHKFRLMTDFVGGVSDGTYGAAALDYDIRGLSGRKSWFYLDDQILCLGAGFKSSQEMDVITSVNQCLAQGDVTVDEGRVSPKGLTEYDGLKRAYHDRVGYLFLEPGKVTLGIQPQSGNWKENVYKAGSPTPETKDVFSIWIDHGAKPQDAHYGYAIFPGISLDEWKTKASQPGVMILSNTQGLQAVRCDSLGITMAVFFQPGTLGGNRSISVDQPCLILFREKEKKITVADPTQKLKEVSVTIDGRATNIALPTGAQAGASTTQIWN